MRKKVEGKLIRHEEGRTRVTDVGGRAGGYEQQIHAGLPTLKSVKLGESWVRRIMGVKIIKIQCTYLQICQNGTH